MPRRPVLRTYRNSALTNDSGIQLAVAASKAAGYLAAGCLFVLLNAIPSACSQVTSVTSSEADNTKAEQKMCVTTNALAGHVDSTKDENEEVQGLGVELRTKLAGMQEEAAPLNSKSDRDGKIADIASTKDVADKKAMLQCKPPDSAPQDGIASGQVGQQQ